MDYFENCFHTQFSLIFLPKYYRLLHVPARKYLYRYSKPLFLIRYIKNVLQDKS